MRTALILEGGAMRGMYTAGILDVFMRNGITFDAVFAVSAGALFGMNLKSKQGGRAFRYNMKYINDKRYLSFRSLIKTGNMMNREFCFNTIPYELDRFDFDEFRSSDGDFYVVVTNIETGLPEYIKIDDVNHETLEYFRASGSLPYISKPVEINGKKYLDGGMSDSIPIEKALEMGFDKVVTVLTRPLGYAKKKSSDFLAKRCYRKKYPMLADDIITRWKRYNAQTTLVGELEKNGRIFVFRPDGKTTVKRMERNLKKLDAMYRLGVSEAENKLEMLKEYLSE